MNKIFIYYSLNSNGDLVAKYFRDNNIEVRKIETKKKMPKSFAMQIFKLGFLAGINYKSKLKDFDNDISKYDEVIIGSPIWFDRLSCPINSLLDKLDLKGKKVTFILYSGGGETIKASEEINKLFLVKNRVQSIRV